jgi:hypothetical protein
MAFRGPEMLSLTLLRLLESPKVPPCCNMSKSAAAAGLSAASTQAARSVNDFTILFRSFVVGFFMRIAPQRAIRVGGLQVFLTLHRVVFLQILLRTLSFENPKPHVAVAVVRPRHYRHASTHRRKSTLSDKE